MAYCTASDVADRFPTAAAELASLVDSFITISEGEIDSALRGAGYKTPVADPVPGLVKEWCILETGFKLLDVLYERANAQEDASYLIHLYNQVQELRRVIRYRRMKPRLPLITKAPIVCGDSLTNPRVSQFRLPEGFARSRREG